MTIKVLAAANLIAAQQAEAIGATMERFDAAAADFAEGIQREASPRPEHFLRQAWLLAAAL